MSIFKEVNDQAKVIDAAQKIVVETNGVAQLAGGSFPKPKTGIRYEQAIQTVAQTMVDKYRGGADDYRVHGLDLVAKIYGTSEEQVVNDAQEVFDQLLAGDE